VARLRSKGALPLGKVVRPLSAVKPFLPRPTLCDLRFVAFEV
jgi:hypothetical protein